MATQLGDDAQPHDDEPFKLDRRQRQPARWPAPRRAHHLDSVSICANHRRYVAMDRALALTPGAIATPWFAAAACVTHPHRGLGTLDGPLGRLAFSAAQAALLRFVHLGLFACNTDWFEQLRRGVAPAGFEGLRGRALDHALVDAEQRRFSQLVRQFFQHDASRIEPFMQALSARFSDSLVLRSRLLQPALHAALQRLRAEAAIDLGCEAHRRCIGRHLVDRLRAERGAAAGA